MQDLAILVVTTNKQTPNKMLEVVMKPKYPDNMSRDELLNQFMALINYHSSDIRFSGEWACHFCGKPALETTMCISSGINNPRPYSLVWMYHLCSTEEGPCMLKMDAEAKFNAETAGLPYTPPARRTEPLVDPASCPSCMTCHKTAEPGKKMMTCGSCNVTRYCGQACQKTDWKRHKPFCKMVVKSQWSNPENPDGPQGLLVNAENWI